MAFSKAFLASLLLSLFLLQLVQAFHPTSLGDAGAGAGAGVDKYTPAKMDCGGACAARCKLSKRPNLCNRACGTCCGRCNCVPPGTAGNYDYCACYANLTTRGNKKKCP